MITRPPCSLASASGSTRATPPGSLDSTIVKPCSRKADSNSSNACWRVTGRSVISVNVPFTRGSITNARPVNWP